MERLIIATKNRGKMREIREILAALPFEIVSMEEAEITLDVDEDGDTFEENALKKADAIWAIAGGMVLADDSGLEVDALGGEPGIYSARYGGEGLDDAGRCQLLLKNLQEIPAERRSARFVCAAAVVSSNHRLVVRGTVEGSILFESQGYNGFGYDPVFLVTEAGISAAMLGNEEKNEISHRGRALEKVAAILAGGCSE